MKVTKELHELAKKFYPSRVDKVMYPIALSYPMLSKKLVKELLDLAYENALDFAITNTPDEFFTSTCKKFSKVFDKNVADAFGLYSESFLNQAARNFYNTYIKL